jgi:hypothetical protein
MSRRAALELLAGEAGITLDPQVVAAALEVYRDVGD